MFETLSYTVKPRITVKDIPYFHVRSAREYPSAPINHPPFTAVKETVITEESFAQTEPSALTDADKREIAFLKSLGLAFEQEGHVYISHRVEPLYHSTDGVFTRYNQAVTPAEKTTALAPYTTLLLSYILPGLYWRSYYALVGLSDNIGISARLKQQMADISEEWVALKTAQNASVYSSP